MPLLTATQQMLLSVVLTPAVKEQITPGHNAGLSSKTLHSIKPTAAMQMQCLQAECPERHCSIKQCTCSLLTCHYLRSSDQCVIKCRAQLLSMSRRILHQPARQASPGGNGLIGQAARGRVTWLVARRLLRAPCLKAGYSEHSNP